MTTEVAVRADLDSGALLVSVAPDGSPTALADAVAGSAAQHPAAVVLDLGPETARWRHLLRGLARTCARHAVPLLIVPALATPAAPADDPARRSASRAHASMTPALASLTAPRDALRLDLPGHPDSAAAAREATSRTLRAWGLDELIFPAELVTSELVSNAVRHAGTGLGLLVRRVRAGVRVAVHDDDPRPPVLPRHPVDALAEGGRGLYLVAATSARWGYLLGTADKIVWAVIR